MQKQQSALTVISGLTSVPLIVLSTVSLQLQRWFIPISLRLILRIVTAYVLAPAWPSVSLTSSIW